jgi:hypothetical protein
MKCNPPQILNCLMMHLWFCCLHIPVMAAVLITSQSSQSLESAIQRWKNSRFLNPWWRSSGTVVRRRTEAKVVGVGSTNERACSCRPSWSTNSYKEEACTPWRAICCRYMSQRVKSIRAASLVRCSCFLIHWQVRKTEYLPGCNSGSGDHSRVNCNSE